MALMDSQTFSSPLKGAVALVVQVSSVHNTVTVKAGSFTVRGEFYELLQDQFFEVVPHATKSMEYRGYLVKDTDTNSIYLLVDEFIQGVETAFDFSVGPYRPLREYLVFVVPSVATFNLSLVDINVKKIVSTT